MNRILYILFLISCGCSSVGVDKTGNIILLSQPSQEISNLSDIATEIEYIPLQTSANSLIRYIYDIKVAASLNETDNPVLIILNPKK